MSGMQSKIAAGFKGAGADATKMLGDEVDSNAGGFQKAIGRLGGIAKAGGVAIAAGIGVGIAGLGALTAKVLSGAGELEQQLGGSEAVFGEFADSIQKTAKRAYSNAGLSQNEFLQGANRMGALFQGAGFTVEQSMNMTAESMQRASDVASIMGIDTTAALEAVTGMAKGNFTMMDNLGVAMNDTAIQAFALSKGIDKTTASMSIQEKVGLANQLFLEKTAKYTGNYKKENDSLAGSLNTTKKAFADLMAGAGSVDLFLEALFNTVEVAMPKIIEVLPRIVKAISGILVGLTDILAESLPTLIPALVSAVTGLITAIVNRMPDIIKVLVDSIPVVIAAFIEIFLAVVKALPQIIKILADAIPMIIDALVTGLTNPEALTAIIMGTVELFLAMIKAIPIIIVALVRAIPTIIENIVKTITSPQFISAMIGAGVELMKALITGIWQMGSALYAAGTQIYNFIRETLSWDNMKRIGGDMMRGLWQGITDLYGWIMSKIKGFSSDIIGGIKGFFGIKSPSTVFASIGTDLNRGLAKGIATSAGLVTNSVNAMSEQALAALGAADLTGSYALTGAAAAGQATGGTTNSNVFTGQIMLGDSTAVREFFKQINQDAVNASMGITPIQGAAV